MKMIIDIRWKVPMQLGKGQLAKGAQVNQLYIALICNSQR